MRLSPVGPEFPPGTDGLATVDRDDLHPLQAEAIRTGRRDGSGPRPRDRFSVPKPATA